MSLQAGMQQGQAIQQKMVAGQAMQQGLKVLQANSMELHTLIRQAMEANPMLALEHEERPEEVLVAPAPVERDDESAGLRDSFDSGEYDSYDGRNSTGTAPSQSALDYYADSIVKKPGLREFLMGQVPASSPDEAIRGLLRLMIDGLDNRGFFADNPLQISQDAGCSLADYRHALALLQDMKPDGVGARDLRESLLIQLRRLGLRHSTAYRIVDSCWEELTTCRPDLIAEKLQEPRGRVDEALTLIRKKLIPNPGAAFDETPDAPIVPDVYVVEGEGGRLRALLRDSGTADLTPNRDYENMLKDGELPSDALKYLTKAKKNADEFIDSIHRRNETLQKIADRLIEVQSAYFRRGEEGLVPLRMEEVADAIGVHISTVSRAVDGKYLQSKWGVKSLRSFFVSGVASTDAAGNQGTVAASGVQLMIKRLVDAENKQKPLSNQKIVELLKKDGVEIARRTVAKYRDELGILPTTMRRQR